MSLDPAVSTIPCEITDSTLPDGVHLVAADGELDVYSAEALKGALWPLASEPRARVVADLTNVAFIDSTALGVVSGAARLLRESGGDVVVVATDPRLVRVFEITGLTRAIRLRSTIAEAVADLGA